MIRDDWFILKFLKWVVTYNLVDGILLFLEVRIKIVLHMSALVAMALKSEDFNAVWIYISQI